jgi:hypothetical protein
MTTIGQSPAMIVDDDEDSESERKDDQPSLSKKLSKTQKKNRNRRKKKKKKISSPNSSSTTTQEKGTTKRGVSFSNVRIRSYLRCFSSDSIPADGGWPLGMESAKFEDADEVALEDYEQAKQESLKQRWERAQEKSIDQAVIENMTKRPPGTPFTFETRQWDYKISLKNPLFRLLHEEQRQALFLGVDYETLEQKPPSPKRRTRSNSVTSASDKSNNRARRSRSNSVSSDHFNETYTQVAVHHVRNELEQLRNERCKSGATGCNCRKLTVYLPPKDGSGGKRAQHRRMKPSKLTQELKKRSIYNPNASREQLERTLHDAVEKEPCCRDDDCFCIRNGIDCQSDACSCWHDSHVHSKPGSAFPTIKEIKSRCGNPFGMYTVDVDVIDGYRSNILKSMICHPVESQKNFFI